MSQQISKMLKEAGKIVVFVATSALAVPYTVAFLANVLYGWPQCEDRYRRAFHPRKVYALNYAILQQLISLKYLRLYLRWRSFYHNATPSRLIKDLSYGINGNNLDIYIPKPINGQKLPEGLWPVVVFVYGGTWGTGDKQMYGLLCSQLADHLQSVVICPNYSTYPKGFIDDMVQDIVDCLAWIHSSCDHFRGDKDRVLLIGHSAGAHLCTMAVIELTLKRLLHNPQALIPPEGFSTQPSSISESIRFVERHFDGNSADNNGEDTGGLLLQSTGPGSGNTTGSFYMVGSTSSPARVGATALRADIGGAFKDPESGRASDNGNTDSFYVVDDKEKNNDDNLEIIDVDTKVKEEQERTDSHESKEEESVEQLGISVPLVLPESESRGREGLRTEEESVVEKGEEDALIKEHMERIIEDEATLSRSQREVRDILSSIKAVIGLAGVYSITDHYEHERGRGVEDVSTMGKAMYGPEHFERFSPTQIINNLPRRLRVPPFQLLHGENDFTVPVSSSVKFSHAVHELGSEASLVLIAECGHTDICMDLMDSTRDQYDPVMGVILDTAQRYL